MLTKTDLKNWLHREFSRLDKLLLILATSEKPLSVSQVSDLAASAGFREPKVRKWNISEILRSSKGKAIRADAGWELTDAGKLHLRNMGIAVASPAAMQIAVDLRMHLEMINDPQTRNFVEEAVKCYEHELYRSAIVMSWLGAMDVLHKHVHANHLAAFNAEAQRVNANWKTALSADDLGRMGESDFLDRLSAISVIGKNTKEELQKALRLRNGCGHPNSLNVGQNKSAAHIETLLQNVFQKF